VLLDQWDFVATGHDLIRSGKRPQGYEDRDPHILETSVPGIFAAGDVRDKSTKQVASAAGEGTTAALMIREYLKTVSAVSNGTRNKEPDAFRYNYT
jgi:thioredoxin reductase (NADPH)